MKCIKCGKVLIEPSECSIVTLKEETLPPRKPGSIEPLSNISTIEHLVWCKDCRNTIEVLRVSTTPMF